MDQRTSPLKMRNSPFSLHTFLNPQRRQIRITGGGTRGLGGCTIRNAGGTGEWGAERERGQQSRGLNREGGEVKASESRGEGRGGGDMQLRSCTVGMAILIPASTQNQL